MTDLEITREHKAILSAADRGNRRYVFDSALISGGSIMATTGRIAARRPIDTEEECLIPPEFLKAISAKKGSPAKCIRYNGTIVGKGSKGQPIDAELGDPRDFPPLGNVMDRPRQDIKKVRVGSANLLALIKALGPIDANEEGSFDILIPEKDGEGILIRRRTSEGKLEGAEGLIMPIIIDNPHE